MITFYTPSKNTPNAKKIENIENKELDNWNRKEGGARRR